MHARLAVLSTACCTCLESVRGCAPRLVVATVKSSVPAICPRSWGVQEDRRACE